MMRLKRIRFRVWYRVCPGSLYGRWQGNIGPRCAVSFPSQEINPLKSFQV